MSTEENRFEGIIVRTYASGDSDLVIRVISPERGKVSLIAKSARKSKRRFPSSMDIFDHGTFETSSTRGSLEPISNFLPLEPFRSIRDDLHKMVAGSVICESFDHLVHDRCDEASEYFEVLKLGLRAIDEAHGTKEILKACYFSLHSLLMTSGFYRPVPDEFPSAKHLLDIVRRIEEASEKELATKQSLVETIRSLIPTPHAA